MAYDQHAGIPISKIGAARLEGEAIGGVQAIALPVGGALHLPGGAGPFRSPHQTLCPAGRRLPSPQVRSHTSWLSAAPHVEDNLRQHLKVCCFAGTDRPSAMHSAHLHADRQRNICLCRQCEMSGNVWQHALGKQGGCEDYRTWCQAASAPGSNRRAQTWRAQR